MFGDWVRLILENWQYFAKGRLSKGSKLWLLIGFMQYHVMLAKGRLSKGSKLWLLIGFMQCHVMLAKGRLSKGSKLWLLIGFMQCHVMLAKGRLSKGSKLWLLIGFMQCHVMLAKGRLSKGSKLWLLIGFMQCHVMLAQVVTRLDDTAFSEMENIWQGNNISGERAHYYMANVNKIFICQSQTYIGLRCCNPWLHMLSLLCQ